jgi:hypothetical protein
MTIHYTWVDVDLSASGSDDLDRDPPVGWCVVDRDCPSCGHRQVSVFPASCQEIECGGCRGMYPVPVLYVDARTPVIEAN